MATSPILKDRYPDARIAKRIAIVEQHIRLENQHDLEGVLGTFGDSARYDEPWGKHYNGRDGVLRQLGVFHEPPSVLGQIGILVTHPITIARALARKVLGK
jgi:hypothetical protein